MHSGEYLTIAGDEITDGAEIIQSKYEGLDSQKWIFKDSHINGWEIVSYTNVNLVISIDGNIENNTRLIVARNEDKNSQMFYMFNITKEENTKLEGVYKIALGKDSSKAIGVSETNIDPNTELNLSKYRK